MLLIASMESIADVHTISSLAKKHVVDELQAPLMVNGIKSYGVVDTGSSVSVISEQAARRFKVRLSQTKRKIRLADGTITKGVVGRDVEIRMGVRMTIADVIVLRECAVDMILGRKELQALGIKIAGIPAHHPGEGCRIKR